MTENDSAAALVSVMNALRVNDLLFMIEFCYLTCDSLIVFFQSNIQPLIYIKFLNVCRAH